LKEYTASTSGMQSNQSRKPVRSRQFFASLTILNLIMEIVDFYWTAEHFIPQDGILLLQIAMNDIFHSSNYATGWKTGI
jgi:hypothetical protein